MADLAAQINAAFPKLIATGTAIMLDACDVTRPTDPGQTPALDDDGNIASAAGPPVYSGPCQLANPTTSLTGGQTPSDASGTPNQRELRVPHTADLRTGDTVTVTASRFSPGLIGDTFVVYGEHERTYAAFRGFIVWGSGWQAPPA